MTSERLGEMFEGDSAKTCAASVDGGASGGSSVRKPRSKDPHQHERKFSNKLKASDIPSGINYNYRNHINHLSETPSVIRHNNLNLKKIFSTHKLSARHWCS